MGSDDTSKTLTQEGHSVAPITILSLLCVPMDIGLMWYDELEDNVRSSYTCYSGEQNRSVFIQKC